MNPDSIAAIQPQEQPTQELPEATVSHATTTIHRATVAQQDTLSAYTTYKVEPEPKAEEPQADTLAELHLMEFGFTGDSIDSVAFLSVEPQGEGGDPTAYEASQNTVIGSLLICCFLVIIYALSQAKGQLQKIVSHVVANRHNRSMTVASLPELRFMFLLAICTTIECALLFYNATTTGIDEESLSTLPTIGIYAAVVLVYIMAKGLGFVVVNWVFFTREQRAAWIDVYVVLTAALGVVLLPIVVMQTYVDIDAKVLLWIVVAVVAMQKIVAMRKAYDIFFSGRNSALHVIPYILTLDLLPIAGLILALLQCHESIAMIEIS